MLPIHQPVLSIETATPICSVALRLPDGSVKEERAEGKGVHSELTFVFAKKLLDDVGLTVSDLGAVLVSGGPGSYTGLRVGGSAVKGLLFQTDVPLYAYNTLGSIALGVRNALEATYCPPGCETVIDARRNHLYHQSWKFDDAGIIPETEVVVRELDEVLEMWESGSVIAGTGIDRLTQLAKSKGVNRDHLPEIPGITVVSAVHILNLSGQSGDKTLSSILQLVRPETYVPQYFSDY